MSDPNEQDRNRWVEGKEATDDGADDFARYADRGRQELGSDGEAAELMAELDEAFAARFPDAGLGAGVVTEPAERAGAEEGTKRPASATIRRLRRLYAVAAAVLALIAAGYWWATTQPGGTDYETIFAEAFSPYANELSDRKMGGGEERPPSTNERLAAASLAYDRRDYAAAATAFADYLNAAPAAAPNISPARLYYGISLLGTGRAEDAIPVLERLSDDATYGTAANWYRALALLRAGQVESARALLSTIAANESSPFAPRASQTLKAIR